MGINLRKTVRVGAILIPLSFILLIWHYQNYGSVDVSPYVAANTISWFDHSAAAGVNVRSMANIQTEGTDDGTSAFGKETVIKKPQSKDNYVNTCISFLKNIVKDVDLKSYFPAASHDTNKNTNLAKNEPKNNDTFWFANLNYLAPVNSLRSIIKNFRISVDSLKSVYGNVFRNPQGRTILPSKDGHVGWIENGVEYLPKSKDENMEYYGIHFDHPSDYQYRVPFNKTLFFQGKRDSQTDEILEPKIILWYMPIGYIKRQSNLEKLRFCPDFPCLITSNRKYTAQSSALVFDGFNLRGSPPPRKPGQVFVFHFVERPISTRGPFQFPRTAWRKRFNWTMTYRTDSDIPVYYGLIRKRPVPLVRDYKALISRKTKMAATLISHCGTHGFREKYIDQIRKYIQVDVYGGCGSHHCARGKDTECGEMIGSTYKFYFAFENALCKDYFTEKFFRYMNTDAVVVARGGEGYWRHVPPEIFINAANFKSPKELADYLIYLDNNPDKYEAILREKSKYVSLFEEWLHVNQWKAITFIHYHYEAIPFCQMCQWLWNVEDHVRTDLDVSEWFNHRSCEEPRDLEP